MYRLSMPLLLLTLGACAPVAPAGSSPGAESDANAGSVSGGSPGEASPLDRGGKPAPPKSGPMPAEPVITGRGIVEESCNAEAAQSFVGRMSSDALVAEVRAASGARIARVIGHDMMVTMEYSGDRLNLRVDEHGTILAVSCG